jgi:hypothetical protein
MQDQEVGRGILSVVVRSPPHALPILRALAKISRPPHLGSQVGSTTLDLLTQLVNNVSLVL